MSKPTDSTDIHREIEELIPIYVSGTIDGVDKQKVESHISTCDACSSQLQFERSMQQSVNEFDDTTINDAMERSFTKFSDRLDSDIEAAAISKVGSVETAPVSRSADSLPSRISRFLSSLIPTSNAQFGGALAMGLAAVVGIGVFVQSPSNDLNQPSNWNTDEFVRSCDSSAGTQEFEFTITPATSDSLDTDAIAQLASTHLLEAEFSIASTTDNIVLTMNGEACDTRVPQLLQTFKAEEKVIQSVRVRNISQPQ